jgi:hypothetical protein
MVQRNAQQLRKAAQMYRDMCAHGGDPQLQAALILLADEFEREAERLEARQNSNETIDRLAP